MNENSHFKGLSRIFFVVGVFTLTAFAFAFMPGGWLQAISGLLGYEGFPHSPLAFYLARNLSLMYGFVGVLFVVISRDIARYLPLVGILGWCAVALGIMQAIADAMAGLPWWWTAGESVSTIVGGAFLLLLAKRQPS